MAGKLVAYYSRADENYFSGQLRYLEIGNTQKVAEKIAELTGADLFFIEQEVPYARSYNECIAQAQEDQKKNARPKLKKLPESLEGYDEIYLGYPNYWGTMPMAVCTFLDAFDWSGKTIHPFCTHEGSGMGRSESDLKKLCPGADVRKGLAIQGSRVDSCDKELKKWIS